MNVSNPECLELFILIFLNLFINLAVLVSIVKNRVSVRPLLEVSQGQQAPKVGY